MNRKAGILAIVLGVQIALAIALNIDFRNAGDADSAVLALERDKVDRIEISGNDQGALLVRKDGRWQLPDYHGLPVADDSVKQLLDRFAKVEGGTPVAVTESAYRRFKVDDKEYERRVVFKQGDKALATVYLGTGAARGRTHARIEGDKAVREIAVSSYELNADPAQWADKALVAVPKEQIAGVEIGGLRVKPAQPAVDAAAGSAPAARQSSAWQAEGLAAGSALNVESVGKLVEGLANLRYETVLDAGQQTSYALDSPVLALKVQRKQGGEREYRIAKHAHQSTYALKLSDRPQVFQLAEYQVRPLLDSAKRETLVINEAAQPSAQHGGDKLSASSVVAPATRVQ